jgi:hypothetical protein
MALKQGPTEAERYQMIEAMRSGQSWGDATAPFRKSIEKDWFDRNEKHLAEVAAQGEEKAPAAATPSSVKLDETQPRKGKG